jgi:hypothetical protein
MGRAAFPIVATMALLWILFHAFYIQTAVLDRDSNIEHKRLMFRSIQRNSVRLMSLNVSIWRITTREGVAVSRSSYHTDSDAVDHIPQFALVIGTIAHGARADCDAQGIAILLRYPVQGWISSGPCIREGVFARVTELKQQLRPHRTVNSRLVNGDHRCDDDKLLVGVDLKGGDLQGFPEQVTSAKACCLICAQKPGCIAWTAVKGAECWMKGAGHVLSKAASSTGKAPSELVSGVFPSDSPVIRAASATEAPVRACQEPEINLLPSCCSARSHVDQTNIIQARPSLSWTSQHPIGTGSFGALVGGIAEMELVPLSKAGFYTFREETEVDSPPPPPQQQQSPRDIAALMRQARQSYLSGDKKSLDGNVSAAIRMGSTARGKAAAARPNSSSRVALGRFEYLLDVAIAYGIPLPSSSGAPSVFPQPAAQEDMPGSGGRRAVLQRLYDRLHAGGGQSSLAPVLRKWLRDAASSQGGSGSGDALMNSSNSIDGTEMLQAYPDVAESHLDMWKGIVSAQYLTALAAPSGLAGEADGGEGAPATTTTTELYYHIQNREWLASLPGDIIAGRFTGAFVRQNGSSSSSSSSSLGDGGGVLIRGASDVSLQFSRQGAAGDGVQAASRVQVASSSSSSSSSLPRGLAFADAVRAAVQCPHSQEPSAPCGFSSSSAEAYMARSTVAAVEFVLRSGDKSGDSVVRSPNAVVCSLIVCLRQASGADEDADPKAAPVGSSGDGLVTCSAVDEVHVFLSAEVGLSNYNSANEFVAVDDLESLKETCWEKVTAAASNGYSTVRSDHIANFTSTMSSAASVQFGARPGGSDWGGREEMDATAAGPELDRMTCTELPSGDRLTSFGVGCKVTAEDDTEVSTHDASASAAACSKRSSVDVDILNKMYSFSQYLMLVSSARAVSNLQGIWADGPTSAWNGDYHLNINLQMNYWAAFSSGLAANTWPPLEDFIRRLSQGPAAATAKDMYGCPGWVSHGFTDSSLRSHPMGDAMWSLCVSCGAWLSLHLWDKAAYDTEPMTSVLLSLEGVLALSKESERVDASTERRTAALFQELLSLPSSPSINALRVFRGVAEFFGCYLWVDRRGVLHTGPVTSPENSFESHPTRAAAAAVGPRKRSVEIMAMSPAIDAAVLREVRLI